MSSRSRRNSGNTNNKTTEVSSSTSSIPSNRATVVQNEVVTNNNNNPAVPVDNTNVMISSFYVLMQKLDEFVDQQRQLNEEILHQAKQQRQLNKELQHRADQQRQKLDEALDQQRQLKEELLQPEVTVSDWDVPKHVKIKLTPDFESLRRVFQYEPFNILTSLKETAHFYCFDGSKLRINDQTSYSVFYQFAKHRSDVTVFVYTSTKQEASLGDNLPLSLPSANVNEILSKSSNCDAESQFDFRTALLWRDNTDRCTLCDIGTNVEACHIVPRRSKTSIAELEEAGIRTVWDTRNGLLLCHTCHKYFDLYLWTLGEDEKVIVANALLDKKGTKDHFIPLVGRTLTGDPSNRPFDWPSSKTFRYHRKIYFAKQEARKIKREEKKFWCKTCSRRFGTEQGFNRHAKKYPNDTCSFRENALHSDSDKTGTTSSIVSVDEANGEEYPDNNNNNVTNVNLLISNNNKDSSSSSSGRSTTVGSNASHSRRHLVFSPKSEAWK